MTTDLMHQEAPYPQALAGLVEKVAYKAGWTFRLQDLDRGQDSKGLTLVINIRGNDSYDPGRKISVDHYMLVPPAAYNERSWTWWLFQQILLVEQHEAMEFFRLGGREPVYAPAHGPGNDPYLVLNYGTSTDRRTSFRGDLSPG